MSGTRWRGAAVMIDGVRPWILAVAIAFAIALIILRPF